MATLLGGVGLFLLGMLLLSDGLKSAAGGALRAILERFARTPGRAVLSGATVTALVQSSSATTLTTIGFVSAGLLTFPQAVGLIFGANLGTTSTGWLVSVLGFKVDLGTVALPLVGVGTLLRLVGKGRWVHGGTALAGFGLLFVGIDILQDGMASLADQVDPATLPGATAGGRLLLVFVGAVLTVVMQSSSAAVATTLTALHAGGIDLNQAAYLVVGQNLGTSVKAILAAIGGGVPVRRTAVAHTLFNVLTAALALLLLPLLLAGASWVMGAEDPALALALFHSVFNLLGVVVLFPVIGRFAGLVERIIPEPKLSLTRNLDPAVAEVPEVAVEVARRSSEGVARVLAGAMAQRLDPPAGEGGRRRLPLVAKTADPLPVGPVAPGASPEEPAALTAPGHAVAEIGPALATIRTFLARVQTRPEDPANFERHLSVLHALDHLDRLEDLRREFDDLGEIPSEVLPLGHALAGVLRRWSTGAYGGEAATTLLRSLSLDLAGARKEGREGTLEAVARGEGSPDEGRVRILHLKRIDRAGYHAWRAAHHLEVASGGRGDETSGDPPSIPSERSLDTAGAVMGEPGS